MSGSSSNNDASVDLAIANLSPTVADVGFTVSEDAVNGTVLGTVTGSDDNNDLLFYTLTSGNDDGIFAIDEDTGELSVTDRTNLDFETTAQYTLTVTLSDTQATTSGQAFITVTDALADVAVALTIDVGDDGRGDNDYGEAIPGEIVTYTLNFANNGGDGASAVALTVDLPDELSAISYQLAAESVTITATADITYGWNIDELAAGAGGTITFTGLLDSSLISGTITATASITTTSPESATDNNDAIINTSNCANDIAVTNANDSGTGSLRQAMADICAGSTITFADDFTIYLEEYLLVGRSMTVDGSGQAIVLSGDAGVQDDTGDNVHIMIIETQDPFAANLDRPVTLNALTFTDGYAQVPEDPDYDGVTAGNAGGALLIRGDEDVTISNSTFTNNQSANVGGAIYNEGTITIEESAFVGNYAALYGGGIENDNGDVTVSNSTLSGNGAGADGGGIDNYFGTLTVIGSTIVSNTANLTGDADGDSSGGIVHGGYRDWVSITGSIIAGNDHVDAADDTVRNPGDCYVDNPSWSGPFVDEGYNLFGANGGCAANADTSLAVDEADLFTTVFNSLASTNSADGAGGVTQLYALLPGSPALDSGGLNCATTDQRGMERPQGEACDIGAYERETVDLAVAFAVAPTTALPGDIITYTITVTNVGDADAADVAVDVTLPTGISAATNSWTIGGLASGISETMMLTATIAEDAALYGSTATALVIIENPNDTNADNDSADASLTIGDAPQLLLDKTVAPSGVIDLSARLTYTVTLENSGASIATGIRFTDTLPATLAFSAWIEQPAGAAANGNLITWIGDLAAGEAITFTYNTDHIGDYGDELINDAVATHFSGDTAASTVNNVSTGPILALAITVDNEQPNEGDRVNYTIELSNYGDSAATNVSVTDTLTGTLANDVSVSVGESIQYQYSVPMADGPTTVVNQVTASATGPITATDAVTVAVQNVTPVLTISGAAMTDEGLPYTLTLESLIDPGDDTITSYVIDWGDGITATVAALGLVNHTYADGPLTATIVVTATDEDGTHQVAAKTVTVNNVAPIASAGGPYTVVEGGVLTLNAGGSDVPDDLLTYAWDLDGDGSFETTGQTVAFTPTIDGPATTAVTVQVSDDEGTAATATATLSVTNATPLVAVGDDQSAAVGEPITVTWTVTDYIDDTFSYTVDWGNGADPELVEEAVAAEYSYSAAGSYTVTVTVTDDDGATASDSLVVTIDAPTLTIVHSVNPTDSVSNGTILTYTVTVSNSTAVPAYATSITTMLPTTLDFVGWIAQPSGATLNGQSLAWNGTVAANSTVILSYQARVDSAVATTIANSANYTHFSANDTATVTTTVLGPPVLDVAMTTETPTQNEGSPLWYQLTITNSGESAATDVTLNDVLIGTVNNDLTLAAGESKVYSYSLTFADGPLVVPNSIAASSSEVSAAAVSDQINVTILNVAPTLTITGSNPTVAEGSEFILTLGTPEDPVVTRCMPIRSTGAMAKAIPITRPEQQRTPMPMAPQPIRSRSIWPMKTASTTPSPAPQ